MLVTTILLIAALVTATQADEAIEEIGEDTTRLFISYYLYNSKGINGPYISSNESIPTYNPSVPTAVIIHDHRGHFRDEYSTTVRKAFVENHDINVFVVDWAFEAGDLYFDVIKVLSRVTDDLIKFLNILRNARDDQTNKNIHLVGFGVGAHVAGEAGFKLRNIARIGRITGLDPSGRDHEELYSHIVSSGDASYVEVIHTDGGALGYGISRAIGNVDFFVNRGGNQPICLTNSCNHDRAWKIFAASLKYDHLVGNRCLTIDEVGADTCQGFSLRLGGVEIIKVPMLPGIYRVNTGRYFPYKLDNFE